MLQRTSTIFSKVSTKQEVSTWSRENFCVAFQSASYLRSEKELINPGNNLVLLADEGINI